MDVSERTRPDAAELVARARGMAPVLREREDAAEAARTVPAETLADFRAAGFFRALQPARYGGYELDVDVLFRIGYELARGCGSSAWVGNLAIVHQWMIAGFPTEAQDDMWGVDPDAVAFGTYAGMADAEPADGGFRISAEWPFASGCDHGQWALLGVRFAPDAGRDGGKPVPGLVLVPAGTYRIVDDWHAVGLAATGSKRIVCEDVFVPAHRHVLFPDLAAGRGPGRADNPAKLYSIPLLAVLPVTIATPALGILHSAIDDFIERTSERRTRGAVAGGGHSMARFAAVQTRLAEACAALDAARLLLERDLAETVAAAGSAAGADVDLRLRNRLSHGYVVKLALEAINGLYAVSGGAGLYRTERLQRAWRDINAISHHIGLNWDAISTMYGQHRLGLEPQGQY